MDIKKETEIIENLVTRLLNDSIFEQILKQYGLKKEQFDDINIDIDEDSIKGEYDSRDKSILLGLTDEEEMYRTLIHEITHWAQHESGIVNDNPMSDEWILQGKELEAVKIVIDEMMQDGKSKEVIIRWLCDRYGHKGFTEEFAKKIIESDFDDLELLIKEDVDNNTSAFTRKAISCLDCNASIIDIPRDGLDTNVWDNMILKPEHKQQILDKLYESLKETGFKNYDNWIQKIKILGSMTSYQYLNDSDIDVHIETSLKSIKEVEEDFKDLSDEALQELLDNLRKKMSTEQQAYLGETKHPIEYYFENELAKSVSSDGIYNVIEDKWEKSPRIVSLDFDIEKEYPVIIDMVNEIMQELDIEIGEIKRDIYSIDEIKENIDNLPEDKKQLFQERIDKKLNAIEESAKQLIGTGKQAIDDRHKDYRAFSDINIKFKFLQKYGYLLLGKMLGLILDNKGVTEESIDDIQDVIEDKDRMKPISYLDINSEQTMLLQHWAWRYLDQFMKPSDKGTSDLRTKERVIKEVIKLFEEKGIMPNSQVTENIFIEKTKEFFGISLSKDIGTKPAPISEKKKPTGSYIVVGNKTKIGWIDMEPTKQYNWNKLKKVALDLWNFIEKDDKFSKAGCKFSGNRGFHILINCVKQWDTDDLRKYLKNKCDNFIDKSHEKSLTTKVTKDPAIMRLDVNTLHAKGSIRNIDSLHKDTGLISKLLSKTEIYRFKRESANINPISYLEIKSETYPQWQQPINIDREEQRVKERGPNIYHDYPENKSDVWPKQQAPPFTLDRLTKKSPPSMNMPTPSPAYYVSMPANSIRCEFEFHDDKVEGKIMWDEGDLPEDLTDSEKIDLLFVWINERFQKIFPILGIDDEFLQWKEMGMDDREVKFEIVGDKGEE